MCFNCMLVHGVSLDSILTGTMVPIPKGNIFLLTCSNNDRAMTLISTVVKVFVFLVLIN